MPLDDELLPEDDPEEPLPELPLPDDEPDDLPEEPLPDVNLPWSSLGCSDLLEPPPLEEPLPEDELKPELPIDEPLPEFDMDDLPEDRLPEEPWPEFPDEVNLPYSSLGWSDSLKPRPLDDPLPDE